MTRINSYNRIVLASFFIFWFIVYHNIFLSNNELIITTDLRYPIREAFHFNTGLYTWLYSNDIFFFNLGYVPIFTFIELLSNIIDYYLIMKVVVTIPMLLSMINMYILAMYINKYLKRDGKIIHILAVIASISYALNPVSLLIFFNNTPLSLGYAFLPLVLYIILSIMNESITYKHLLLSALITSMMFTQFHNVIFYLLIPLLLSSIISFILKRPLLKQLSVLGVLTILVSSYAIIPISYIVINGYFKDSTPIYNFDSNMLAFMFKDSSILNDLSLVSYPWDFKDAYYNKLPEQYFKLINIASIFAIIAGVVISGIYDKDLIFILLIAITLIISAISLSLWSQTFSLSISYGWIFRDPTKFLPLISFGFSLLIIVLNPKHGSRIVFTIILAIISTAMIVKALPILSIEEYVQTYDNDRLLAVNEFLKDKHGKIVWLPVGSWERVYRDTLELSTPYPSMDTFSTLPYNNMDYLSMISSHTNIEPYLDLIGVNYVGIDYKVTDPSIRESLTLKTAEIFDGRFELVFERDEIKIYKKNDADMLWIPYNVYSKEDARMFLKQGMLAKNVVVDDGVIGHASMIQPIDNSMLSLIIVNSSKWILSLWYNHNNTIANEIEYLTLIDARNDYLKIGRYANDIIIESRNSKISYDEGFDHGWNNLIIYSDDALDVSLNGINIFSHNANFDDVYIYLDRGYLGYKGILTANLYLDSLEIDHLYNAYIESYTNIDPTKWKASILSEKPFLLCFSEVYDKFWEARVYSNGKLVRVVESIPIYGLINGFWIDHTGRLDVEIVYKPQEVFYASSIVSILALLIISSYLFVISKI